MLLNKIVVEKDIDDENKYTLHLYLKYPDIKGVNNILDHLNFIMSNKKVIADRIIIRGSKVNISKNDENIFDEIMREQTQINKDKEVSENSNDTNKIAIPISVTVNPHTINLKNNQGNGIIDVRITFSKETDIQQINLDNIRLNGGIIPDKSLNEKVILLKHKGNGEKEITLKFRRNDIRESLLNSDGEIVITGETDTLIFQGSYTVNLIK